MAVLDIEGHTLTTPDGADILYFDAGGEGAPVVFANGLGGPFLAWKHQVDYLRDRYRIVSWSYRGLFGSSCPATEPVDLTVPRHARDAECVLTAAGIPRAAFVGWSMGVPVVLDLCSRRPELVSHLVLINGTFGDPLATSKIPFARRLLPELIRRVRLMRYGSRILRHAAGWPETVVWLKRLGIVGATVDEDLFREVAPEFGNTDVGRFLATLRALGEYDATDPLARVTAPTLVIAGQRDPFTSPDLARRMTERIRDGEILVVRGATHYTPIEYPELVNLRIEKFFREHGFGEPLTESR